MTLSLKQYYASARGISTAIAAAAVPFASKIVGPETSAVLFPPLGNMEGVARLGFLALCIAVSLGVYFLVATQSLPSPARVIWCALLIAFVALAVYLVAYQSFVRRIDIPSRGDSVYVSIGYERTQFAIDTFGNASDYEMLKARGPNEEEISHLWTLKSIIIARLTLYFSCVLTSLTVLFLFSFSLAHEAPLAASVAEPEAPDIE
jgi:hypothetical protein